MKKQILYLATVAMTAGLAACSSDELESTSQLQLKSGQFAAAIPEAVSTRVVIGDDYKATWNTSAKDKEAIGIYYENDGKVTGNYKYTLADAKKDEQGNESGLGVFESESSPAGTAKYAYYPYAEKTGQQINNGKITIKSLVDSYIYDENVVKMPMVGTINGSTIAFKNTTALLKITVVNMPASKTYAKLSYNGNSNLTGTGVVDATEDEPTLVMSSEVAGGKVIKIYKSETAKSADTDTFTAGGTYNFYFILPVNNYQGDLTFTLGTYDSSSSADVDDTAGESVTDVTTVSYTNSLDAQRNTIYAHTLRYENGVLQDDNLNKLNEQIANGGTSFSADLSSAKGTIYIPEGSQDLTLNLILSTTEDNKITIAPAKEGAETPDVTINLQKSSTDVPKLDINLPKSDVTLNVVKAVETKVAEDDPTLTLTAVEASVQDILRISKGLTVSGLKMTAGNAYIATGATVTNSGSNACYFFDEVAEKETGSNNVKIVPLSTYKLFYPSANEDVDLKSAVSPLQKIVIPAGTTMNLDLKGLSITGNVDNVNVIEVNGTLNIKDSGNGTDETAGSITSDKGAATILVGKTGVVNVEKGVIANTYSSSAKAAVQVSGQLNLKGKGAVVQNSQTSNLSIEVLDGGKVDVNVPVTNVPATGNVAAYDKATLAVTGNVSVESGAEFKLENGEVDGTITAAATSTATKTAKVTITDGLVKAASTNSALDLTATNTNVEASISGGEITSGGTTISLTGDNSITNAKSLKLAISGGKVTTTSSTAYAITDGTAGAEVTISGGTISNATAEGKAQGTAIKQTTKGGKLHITGGSISAAKAIEITEGALTVDGDEDVKVNGSTDALTITPSTASNDVVISLANANAKYVGGTNSFNHTSQPAKSLSISAGYFEGQLVSQNTLFISGGSFYNCTNLKAESSWVTLVTNSSVVSYNKDTDTWDVTDQSK